MGANWEQRGSRVGSRCGPPGAIRMGWLETEKPEVPVSFRYGGRLFTTFARRREPEARPTSAWLRRLERNLRLLEEGILELPRGVDLAAVPPLRRQADGEARGRHVVTLAGLVGPLPGSPAAAHGENTLDTVDASTSNHLKETLGDGFAVRGLDHDGPPGARRPPGEGEGPARQAAQPRDHQEGDRDLLAASGPGPSGWGTSSGRSRTGPGLPEDRREAAVPDPGRDRAADQRGAG